MEQDGFDWLSVEIAPKAEEKKVEEKKVEAKPTKAEPVAQTKGLTLCVDCYPCVNAIDLNAWVYDLAKTIAKDTGEQDIRLSKREGLSFGKWKAVLAEAALLVPLEGVCYVTTTELTEPVIEALCSKASLVVRGRR